MTFNAIESNVGGVSATLSTLPLQATTNPCADTYRVPEYSVPRFLPFTAPSRKAASSKSVRTNTSSRLETLAAWHLQAAQIPKPEREMRFHPERRWRWDMCWKPQMVALEIEGAIYVNGRHTRGAGFEADLEKHNAAQLLGWTVIRVTERHINDGRMVDWVREALGR